MPDWRSIPKIDAHIHLLPPDVIAVRNSSSPLPTSVTFMLTRLPPAML